MTAIPAERAAGSGSSPPGQHSGGSGGSSPPGQHRADVDQVLRLTDGRLEPVA